MPVTEFPKIDYKKKRDGVFFKSITGTNSQLVIFKYEKGEKTDHSHPVEQVGYVLSGKADLFIGDQEYSLKEGDAYYIPGDVRHGFSVNADEGLELIESYTPPKSENTY